MAMTIRFDDDEMEQLRAQADRERRSMAEVVRLAVHDRIARSRHRDAVRGLARQVIEEDHDILTRLADS